MPPKRKKPSELPSKPPLINANQENPELMRKFEIELCWCIENLQRALKSGKLSEKQAEKSQGNLNILMSGSAPIIMKKQIMRQGFGDYRTKIEEEQKKAKAVAKCKVSTAEPSKKSQFVKKSMFASSSNDSFKFNFDVKDCLEDELSKVKLENESDKKLDDKKNFQFAVSNNSFRFNFSNEND